MPGDQTSVGRVSLTAPNRDALTAVVPILEDALRTTSWPTQATLGDAVLMIRKLDLGVLGRRPSRQAISALIATRLADMPLIWSAIETNGHDAPVMVWPSKAAGIAHAAIVIKRLGQSGAALPWWVPRVLGVVDVQPGQALRAVVQAARHASKVTGQGALIAVLDILCSNAAPDLAAEVAVQIMKGMPLPDVLREALAPDAAKTAQHQRPTAPRDPAILQQSVAPTLAAVIKDLPPPARQIWVRLAPTPFIRAMAPSDQATLAFQLGYLTTAPASQQAYARRVAKAVRTAKARMATTKAVDAAPRTKAYPAADQPPETPKTRSPHNHDTPGQASAKTTPNVFTPESPDHRALEQTMAGGIVGMINLIAQAGIPAADEEAGTDLALSLLRGFLARLPETQLLQDALPEVYHESADLEGWACPADLLDTTPRQLRARRKALLFADGATGDVAKAGHADALHNGLMILLSRQVRQLTGRGWRHLVTRPALFTVSPTHLDVVVDLDDVRIAERRAGLDLSPGWVPWLGRVVTLHFERFDPPVNPVGALS